MSKRLLLLLLLLIFTLSGCTPRPAQVGSTGYYFDTVVTMTLYGPDEGRLQELIRELHQACARYENLLSRTVPGSDVSRINDAAGQTVVVDAETWQLLQSAKELSRLTRGAFSVTVAPLTSLWQFTGENTRIPSPEERLAALPLVDDSLIALGEGHTVTLPAGMSIDLGGIAKGYIADRLTEVLRGQVTGAMLNIGGNVYVLGRNPAGERFQVGIVNPKQPSAAIRLVAAEDLSVVTSGTYQRRFTENGQTYHHILDPSTGLPADTGLASATVIAPDSMTADALATACIVLGPVEALHLLEGQGLDGLLILEDGQILTTVGFAEKYD